MSAEESPRPPLPPFDADAAAQKVRGTESDRKYHWPLGPSPKDHPGLSELGL